MQLENQVAIVTGAGNGIGRAIAAVLAGQGARVVLTGRTLATLEDAAKEIREQGGQARAAIADVTLADDLAALVALAEDTFGPVDILVNNAGQLVALGPVWEIDPVEWWRDVEVNLFGVLLGMRAVLPGMRARGRGRIVNLAGGGARKPMNHASGYGCSKAASVRLTESTALELRGSGVSVFSLNPGFVRTSMTEQFVKTPAGQKWMKPYGDRLEEGIDISPQAAGTMAAALCSGRFDALSGRFFAAESDLDHLDRLAAEAERIAATEERLLRLR